MPQQLVETMWFMPSTFDNVLILRNILGKEYLHEQPPGKLGH